MKVFVVQIVTDGRLLKLLVCPECQSEKIWKAGFRYVHDQPVQRFLCRDCGYRFSDPNYSRKIVNSSYNKQSNRQICALETKGAKNLTRAKRKETKALRETVHNSKSNLINFSWHLKKIGRAEETIKTYTNYLQNISKDGNLNDPEEVKGVIATRYNDTNTKRLACNAYDAFIKFVGGKWKKPKYRPENRTTFIPTEEELTLAINCGHKESVIYSKFLYETGARANEAQRVEWTDLNTEKSQVTIKASKHGKSRIVEISDELMKLLFSLPKDRETVFRLRPKNSRSSAFHNRMIRQAKIHDNPRMLKIHLHTFRHCKALREYHKTRDILHVMVILGHKKVETTMVYVRLYNQIYKNQQANKFITKIASTKEERIELKNDGWECWEKDGEDWYFSKPK
jgi:integrase